MQADRSHRAGFTLIETLAALAIASTIILSTSMLIHQGVFFFDRGTQTIDQAEQLTLALDSLTRDFGAARFILQKSPDGLKVAFAGVPANENEKARIIFVTAGGHGAGPGGEEVVSLTVETASNFSQLVRRQTEWTGPGMRLADARPKDPVVLLNGRLAISFNFSELTPNGTLAWHDRWTDEASLPYSVRLNLRDGKTGADLMSPAEFLIYADAPAACSDGKANCLSLATTSNAGSGGEPGDQQSSRPATRE